MVKTFKGSNFDIYTILPKV